KYYDPGHWSNSYTTDELTEWFVSEINDGVDARDAGGPLIQRTPHCAGVIKIASGEKFSAREERIFAAAAHAHVRTGCPILTHTEHGERALEQIENLRSHGVDLGHVCLSHTDRKPDVGY